MAAAWDLKKVSQPAAVQLKVCLFTMSRLAEVASSGSRAFAKIFCNKSDVIRIRMDPRFFADPDPGIKSPDPSIYKLK